VLIARNALLSTFEIEYLGRKFGTYLALGHKLGMPRIRQAMELAGGYVLYLDALNFVTIGFFRWYFPRRGRAVV
jgi:hypothetical protein